MCDNNENCSQGTVCLKGECVNSQSLHVSLSNTFIILPIVMTLIFIGVFVGLTVLRVYIARKRAANMRRETDNHATLQAQAERASMQNLQNQPYQHPDIPSQYNPELQSYMQHPDQPHQVQQPQQGHWGQQQPQYQPQNYQPVPPVGAPNHPDPNQQYYMAQQQLYAGMPQAQQYQMTAAVAPQIPEGQGIVQPIAVVGDSPTAKKDPDLE